MGVSVYIVGLREPTPEYRRKLAAYRACDAAGVEPPKELSEFFDWASPADESLDGGQRAEVSEAIDGGVEYDDGAIVDLSKLPKGVTKLRVYMS